MFHLRWNEKKILFTISKFLLIFISINRNLNKESFYIIYNSVKSRTILNPLYFHKIFPLRLLLHVVYIVSSSNHEINVGNVKARQVFQCGFTFSSESKKTLHIKCFIRCSLRY